MKIEIKDETLEKIQKVVDKSKDFNDVEEFVNKMLEKAANDLQTDLNPEEEEVAEERLRSLGYIN